MKVYLDMVGCRLNQAEIESMAMEIASKGGKIVTKAEEADYVIVNTCCVTAKASADSRKMLRRLASQTSGKIISTGCWATIFDREAKNLHIIDQLFDNEHKNDIPKAIISGQNNSEVHGRPDLGPRKRTRAFIKVQDGCMNQCAYCLTSIARGPSISVDQEEVIEKIHLYEDYGVNEIVLTGVQIGSWGRDLKQNKTLRDLLEKILLETSVPRIRISSIEPWDITQSLIELLTESRICPHLHIPLQSGSDSILKMMRRPISTKSFFERIESIRKIFPDFSITTDVIAGFPGETISLFNESVEFIKKCNFDNGHIFKYSQMPGTEAASFKDQITPIQKQKRSSVLREIFVENHKKHIERRLDSTDEVLVESTLAKSTKVYSTGYTRDFLRVYLDGVVDKNNSILPVKIKRLNMYGDLTVEIVD